ncbi:MAG: hypothetical protein HY787_13225 [Deltaproteobacteria bacterium]|nr:hypothetical protein [Deltaproteobacteria bacterium]
MQMKKTYIGKWRITEMEMWDKEYIDMVVPGHLTIEKDGTGSLQFGVVEVEMDCRIESIHGEERLDFTFEGSDEGDQVCGRGWAQITGRNMKGRIYFHLGDDSAFTATLD